MPHWLATVKLQLSLGLTVKLQLGLLQIGLGLTVKLQLGLGLTVKLQLGLCERLLKGFEKKQR